VALVGRGRFGTEKTFVGFMGVSGLKGWWEGETSSKKEESGDLGEAGGGRAQMVNSGRGVLGRFRKRYIPGGIGAIKKVHPSWNFLGRFGLGVKGLFFV